MWQIWLGISSGILLIALVYVISVIKIYKKLKNFEAKLLDAMLYIHFLKEEVAIGKQPVRELYDKINLYNWNVERFNKVIGNFPVRRIANKYGIESKEKYLKM